MSEEGCKPPITYGFGRVFRRIRRRERFLSPPAEELDAQVFEALVAAAIAKCVDFNVAINRSRRYDDEEFAFVSGLRGICEDLISLCYIRRLSPAARNEISKLLIRSTLSAGIKVQQAFFSANNPFQPILTATHNSATGETATASARRLVREFWVAQGISRQNGPTVKDMATEVGLKHTYDYIYFASSNFVHFNPQALLRMGWGSSNGPFQFSVSHLSGYYKSLASFYGSIIFLGYHSAFSLNNFRTNCEKEVVELLELIDQVHRWPEVVTFEEMNQTPPLYLLTHAMRKAFPEEGAPTGGILEEVRGLGHRLGGSPE